MSVGYSWVDNSQPITVLCETIEMGVSQPSLPKFSHNQLICGDNTIDITSNENKWLTLTFERECLKNISNYQ